ncbi:MAG: cysteine hydrolase family protein [Mesorhizobium sp.]|nr:MAG: cysteine hydrolase family protein [Mesorhizobium sp.]
MSWKTGFRSLYYLGAPEPDDPVLVPAQTAILIIDVQNTYLERPDRASLSPQEQQRYDLWTPFHERMHGAVIPTKTTDSALTGTNLRLILHNLGIRNVICCGIFTDQCVSSTVRSLADESFAVIVIEDCCAAATDELHRKELEIINMIYCHVMSSAEFCKIMALAK